MTCARGTVLFRGRPVTDKIESNGFARFLRPLRPGNEDVDLIGGGDLESGWFAFIHADKIIEPGVTGKYVVRFDEALDRQLPVGVYVKLQRLAEMHWRARTPVRGGWQLLFQKPAAALICQPVGQPGHSGGLRQYADYPAQMME
jgi:hypothetical protein